MKFYNKETLDENGVYYRKGDWGIEMPSGWDPKYNFTSVAPPEEAFNGISCEWDENLNTWILNTEEKDIKDSLNILDTTDKKMARVLEDLINTLVTKGTISIEDLPVDAQEKLAERQEARDNL